MKARTAIGESIFQIINIESNLFSCSLKNKDLLSEIKSTILNSKEGFGCMILHALELQHSLFKDVSRR